MELEEFQVDTILQELDDRLLVNTKEEEEEYHNGRANQINKH